MPDSYFWTAYTVNENGDERDINLADGVRSHSVTEASNASIYMACGFTRETGHLSIQRDFDGRAYIYADGTDDHVAMVVSEGIEDSDQSSEN